jgi:large subunit ribosomal protein L24
MNKIRNGDEIIVIAGKDKGKRGKVIRLVQEGKRALVESINMVKKHVKPNPRTNQPGGIIPREAPIAISNIALLNPVTQKADRVGFKYIDDGAKKVRYFKSNGELVDV